VALSDSMSSRTRPGIEGLEEDGGGPLLADLEGHHLSTDVVQRHGVHVDVTGCMPKRTAPKRAALVIPRWVSSAPLGVPVVPDV
jgi:hypothetical protein